MIREMLVSSVSDGEEEVLIGIEREKVKKVEFISKDILENSGVLGIKTGDAFIPLVAPSGILKGKIKVKYMIVTERVAVGVTRIVGFLKPTKEMKAREIADFVDKAFETSEGIVFLIDLQKVHPRSGDMDIVFEVHGVKDSPTSDLKGESLILLNYEGKDWVVRPDKIKGIAERMNEFKVGKIKGFVTYENKVIPVFGSGGKWIVILEDVGLLCTRVDRLRGTVLNIEGKEKWAAVGQRKIPFLNLEGVRKIGI